MFNDVNRSGGSIEDYAIFVNDGDGQTDVGVATFLRDWAVLMAAEGRWTTWSDEDDAPHVARLDVPGNEELENAFLSGNARRPTREELQRAIEWTAQHPEWQQEVEQDFADEFGVPWFEADEIGAQRSQEGDTGSPDQPPEPARSQGPRFYMDTRGNVMQADYAPDPQRWWRLILGAPETDADFAAVDAEVEASLAEGEPAIIVPSDFPFLSPAEQIRISHQVISDMYGTRRPLTQGVEGLDVEGRFRRHILNLQRQWGVNPDLEYVPGGEYNVPEERSLPLGPESRLLQPAVRPIQLTLGSPTATTIATGPSESTIEHWFDMLGRDEQGIPSQLEGDIGVPRFDPFDPGKGYPMRQLPVDPRRTPMPQVPPESPRHPSATTSAV